MLHHLSYRSRTFVVAGLMVACCGAAARAQFMKQQACAAPPEGSAANVQALAATCGSATFPVDAALRQEGELRIATGANIYIRKIRLSYGGSIAGPGQQAEIAMHRLLSAGELTEPFPTARAGLGLQSVSVDVSPPGYGADQVLLSLKGRGDAPPKQNGAGDWSGKTLSATALPAAELVVIGSTFAHLSQLRDTIAIGRNKGRFEAIVIASRGNDLPVQSVLVVPVGGTAFAVDLRTILAAGTLSDVIVIDPPDFLHEVTVTYGTVPQHTRIPTLEVRGRYADSWLGRVGENRQYAGGWVLLGTVDVIVSPHTASAANRFRIAGQDGPFKKLRFVARRGAVDLAGVAVDAGDGRQETLPVNSMLLPDVQSAPFTFSAGALPIASVALTPRLHASSRVNAAVEVWAQY